VASTEEAWPVLVIDVPLAKAAILSDRQQGAVVDPRHFRDLTHWVSA